MSVAAPAKPHWLNRERLRVYSIAMLVLYLAMVAACLYRAYWVHDLRLTSAHEDFVAFWSSGWLALHGHGVSAYDVHQLTPLETHTLGTKLDGLLPWLYPPTAWLFFAPCALLPYWSAAAVYLTLCIVAFVAMARMIVPDRSTFWVALAFTGVALTVLSGQNGLLTATLAGLGLLLLERRPALAGICFALLAFKPQVAALVPIALLCGRQWRALMACALAFLAIWAVSLAWFGVETLPAFLHNLGSGAGYISSSRYKIYRMPSFFVTATMLHLPVTVAYAAQGLSALAALGAVAFAWLRPCPHALRAAVLACATLLVSPYLYDYDLTWYGLVIAWTCRHALDTDFRRGEREWLIVLWLLPEFGSLITAYVPFQFMPFVTAATLWLLTRRVIEARRAPIKPLPPTSHVRA